MRLWRIDLSPSSLGNFFPFMGLGISASSRLWESIRLASWRSLVERIYWGSPLYHALYLFFKVVEIFNVIPFNLVEFSPSSRLRPIDLNFLSCRHMNVIQVESLLPHLLAASVQGREALQDFPTSLKFHLILEDQGASILPWVLGAFGVRGTLFHVIGLLLGITRLAIYISFHPYDHIF